MPRGDAARIRAHVVELADAARGAGETGITVRAGDVREALDLDYRNAVIDICQVGDPHIPKRGRGGTGGAARAQSGPGLGFRVQAPRRQGIAPDGGGGFAPAGGPGRLSAGRSRRRWPFPAGASVYRGPGGSPGVEAGRDSARTDRSNVTNSPVSGGGLAVSAGRRYVEGEVYPYLLRNTRITRPNQMWAADITYLPMARGFLYLVVVMDWHSRYVVATLWKSVFASALTEALDRGRPDLFNTGQGS